MKVILIMAQTLDGIISRSSNEFIDWTGSADKKMFMKLTKEAGVLVMGSKTYDTIGRPLPGRKNIILTRNKERISDDPNLIYTDDSPEKILLDLEKEGYTSVALAGGTQVNSIFAKQNCIDEVIITVAPRIFGSGLRLFNEPLDLQLQLLFTEVLDDNFVMMHYQVLK
jgi:dihydrofolate reductase